VVATDEAFVRLTVWTMLTASTALALETDEMVGAASSSVMVPTAAMPPTLRL
jgi:hypothetical protein